MVKVTYTDSGIYTKSILNMIERNKKRALL